MPSNRVSTRSGSASIPASASARPWSRTSSWSRGSTCSCASVVPVLIGLSRKSSLGRILGDPERTHGLALGVARRSRRRIRARRDDPPRPRREGARGGPDRGPRDRVIVEIHGLELFGRHGVGETERQGRPDIPLRRHARAAGPRGGLARRDGRLSAGARSRARPSPDARAYELLESLAAATAEAIAAGVPVDAVTVRVRKPGIAWAEWTAATATRRARRR